MCQSLHQAPTSQAFSMCTLLPLLPCWPRSSHQECFCPSQHILQSLRQRQHNASWWSRLTWFLSYATLYICRISLNRLNSLGSRLLHIFIYFQHTRACAPQCLMVIVIFIYVCVREIIYIMCIYVYIICIAYMYIIHALYTYVICILYYIYICINVIWCGLIQWTLRNILWKMVNLSSFTIKKHQGL